MKLSDAQWKDKLSNEEFRVLRSKGTELPFSGDYNDFDDSGTYACAGCGNSLFKSESKFDSGCGWPSFDAVHPDSQVLEVKDYSNGMERVEVLCASCDGHLGHLFNDGPTATKLRYCINSVSINFKN